MSKVKISGNASGTGVVTLTAPNTNTDRTITLPDGDITLGVGIDDNATSTAITIDASENVGIGTSSPTSKLHIESTLGDGLKIKRTSTGTAGGIGVGAVSQGLAIYATDYYANTPIVFRMGQTDSSNNPFVGGSEKMRIDYNGNVGIGTASPVGKFAVSDGTTTGEINPSGGVCWVGTRSSHDVVMQVGASEKLRIKADGRGLSQFTAKAWVNYHGVNNTIRDSHNVSSITDNGTGQYVMNFANSFPNNDYAVSGSGTRSITEDSYLCGITCPNNGFGTSSVRIKGHDYNSTQDLYQMHATIFGD